MQQLAHHLGLVPVLRSASSFNARAPGPLPGLTVRFWRDFGETARYGCIVCAVRTCLLSSQNSLPIRLGCARRCGMFLRRGSALLVVPVVLPCAYGCSEAIRVD